MGRFGCTLRALVSVGMVFLFGLSPGLAVAATGTHGERAATTAPRRRSDASTVVPTRLVAASGVDDEIPGIGRALPFTVDTESLDPALDADDVSRVYLTAGQSLHLRLSGAAGTDFDMYLYDASATTVANTALAVDWSTAAGTSVESIDYRAPVTGYYYIDLYAQGAGTGGAYRLDAWPTAPTGDDDVPGTAVQTIFEVTDALTPVLDTDDVYAVPLVAGQRLSLVLSADAGTDFDLFVFGPGTGTVAAMSNAWYWSYNDGTSSEAVAFTARSTGTYFVNVHLYDETAGGAYTLASTLLASEADDDLPGVPYALFEEPTIRSLDGWLDTDDVHHFWMSKGSRVTVTLLGDAGSDMDLRLYAQGVASIRGAVAPLAASVTPGTSDEQIVYTATTSSFYFVDVRTAFTRQVCSYILAMDIEAIPELEPTQLTITQSATSVRYPKPFVLSGVLQDGHIYDPCVVMVKKPGSSRWSYSSARLCYQESDYLFGGAKWWYRYTPKLRGYYRFYVKFDGNETHEASRSREITVRVR